MITNKLNGINSTNISLKLKQNDQSTHILNSPLFLKDIVSSKSFEICRGKLESDIKEICGFQTDHEVSKTQVFTSFNTKPAEKVKVSKIETTNLTLMPDKTPEVTTATLVVPKLQFVDSAEQKISNFKITCEHEHVDADAALKSCFNSEQRADSSNGSNSQGTYKL